GGSAGRSFPAPARCCAGIPSHATSTGPSIDEPAASSTRQVAWPTAPWHTRPTHSPKPSSAVSTGTRYVATVDETSSGSTVAEVAVVSGMVTTPSVSINPFGSGSGPLGTPTTTNRRSVPAGALARTDSPSADATGAPFVAWTTGSPVQPCRNR